jgi:hypothetical protein
MDIRHLRQEPGDLRVMMALLKALWKLRPTGNPEAPSARLIRRRREKRLLDRLEREWPGGSTDFAVPVVTSARIRRRHRPSGPLAPKTKLCTSRCPGSIRSSPSPALVGSAW